MVESPDSARDSRQSRYLEGDLIDGKYRLIRPIGEGGMGVVWMGRNVVLNLDVAIKLIHASWANDGILAKRFLQEARTAAQLAHPAICRVFDYGRTHHGDPFIVSELLEGETLAELIDRKGRMTGAHALQAILPVMDGLAVAHATGIVHRDVKSENIFLARDLTGRLQPKLLDFGVARFVNQDHKITVEGSLLGTPDYMSPEQARGETGLDFRTDIWSVSVVLYELLTTRVPFQGENYNAVMWSILNEDVKPITEYSAGNESLWQLIERGLRKDPMQRWDSMRTFGAKLAEWLYKRGVREDTSGASLRATWLLGLTADPTAPLMISSPPAIPTPIAPTPVPPSDSTKVTVADVVPISESLSKSRRWVTVTVASVAALLLALGVWIGAAFSTQPAAGASSQAEVRADPSSAVTVAQQGATVPGSAATPRPEAPASADPSASSAPASSAAEPPAALRRPRWHAPAKRRGKVDFGF